MDSGATGAIRNTPFQDPDDIQGYVDWIVDVNALTRTDVVIGQMQSAGLFPTLEAPAYNQHGGLVPHDFDLTISSPSGRIYYMLDGSDPRVPGSSQQGGITSTTLVVEDAEKRVLVPTRSISNNWKGRHSFDDSVWSVIVGSPGGVGYERS